MAKLMAIFTMIGVITTFRVGIRFLQHMGLWNSKLNLFSKLFGTAVFMAGLLIALH